MSVGAGPASVSAIRTFLTKPDDETPDPFERELGADLALPHFARDFER